jgi:hypothetical protein
MEGLDMSSTFREATLIRKPRSTNFRFLTIKLHLWLMTNDVDQKGYYVSTKHTLTTMKFYDVDNFKMEGSLHLRRDYCSDRCAENVHIHQR